MICNVGETLSIPVEVEILKAFAYQDRVYYIAKPLKSLASAVWILSTDGEPLDVSEELVFKAYSVIGNL